MRKGRLVLILISALVFSGLFFSYRPYIWSQENSIPKPYSNSKFIDVDGVRLHYRFWKIENEEQKPWILLVHGFSGSSFSWSNLVDTLNSIGYNVVAVDVPPYGYSDKSLRLNHSPDSRAELIWKFTNSIDSKSKWTLVGHSMGGGIVAAMALLQPHRVDKTILVAPALFKCLSEGKRSFRQKLMSFPPVEWVAAGFARIYFVRPKKFKKSLELAYGRKPSADEFEAYYLPFKQKGMVRGVLSSFSRSNPTKILDITDFETNSLAIWGTKDSWVPYERMKSITDSIHSLSVVLIEGAGHIPMETNPNDFNKLIVDFLLSPE
jgi:2-hydroxy-6-oxonona-2,4-dienedioate hydrolase